LRSPKLGGCHPEGQFHGIKIFHQRKDKLTLQSRQFLEDYRCRLSLFQNKIPVTVPKFLEDTAVSIEVFIRLLANYVSVRGLPNAAAKPGQE
jgi:hypothetical protein